VLHSVKYDGQSAGIIVYECKRTKRIENSHIRQAQRAKRSRDADFVVLVTTGKKPGFDGFDQIRDVLVVAPLGVIPLASLLRNILIEMLKAGITKSERVAIAERLMQHISSPLFKNSIEEAIQRTSDLGKMLQGEFKAHVDAWKKRWEYYQTMHWDISQVQANLQRVLHGKEPKRIDRPKVSQLALPAPTRPLLRPRGREDSRHA
jgi:hypothetical protein